MAKNKTNKRKVEPVDLHANMGLQLKVSRKPGTTLDDAIGTILDTIEEHIHGCACQDCKDLWEDNRLNLLQALQDNPLLLKQELKITYTYPTPEKGGDTVDCRYPAFVDLGCGTIYTFCHDLG
jgi:hypothetical protein